MHNHGVHVTEGFDLAVLGFLVSVLIIVVWGGLQLVTPNDIPIRPLYTTLQYFIGGSLVLGAVLLVVRLAQWVLGGGDR